MGRTMMGVSIQSKLHLLSGSVLRVVFRWIVCLLARVLQVSVLQLATIGC